MSNQQLIQNIQALAGICGLISYDMQYGTVSEARHENAIRRAEELLVEENLIKFGQLAQLAKPMQQSYNRVDSDVEVMYSELFYMTSIILYLGDYDTRYAKFAQILQTAPDLSNAPPFVEIVNDPYPRICFTKAV